ncbi:MAG: hypothetical protein WDN72_01370 [Alphaproteobacteria bacterium]
MAEAGTPSLAELIATDKRVADAAEAYAQALKSDNNREAPRALRELQRATERHTPGLSKEVTRTTVNALIESHFGDLLTALERR